MNGKQMLGAALLVTSAACSKLSPSPPVGDGPQAATDAGAARTAATPTSPAPPAAPLSPIGNVPALPKATGKGKFAISGRSESAIEVVVPAKKPASPPLVIAFHGTGEEPENILASFDIAAKAEALGFVAIAPRAGHRDTEHPPDVDHPINWGGSSWNMWTQGADKNEDLVYVRALIESAKKTWNADTTRVYVVGFSNGGYFSYFVAASMPDRIAGFGEMSAGWTTDACPTRTDADGNSLYLMTTGGPPAKEIACSAVMADKAFPAKCRVTAANKLHAPVARGRVPFGYLAHYTVDDSVSVAWSCLLAEGLGARAKTVLRSKETDGTTGHYPMPDFFDGAWKFWANRSTAQ